VLFLDNLALFDLNPIHIAFVLVLALLLFGPQKLPEIGKQLGSALRELKRAGNQLADSFNTDHEPDSRYNGYSSGYSDNYSGYDNNVSRSTPAITSSTDMSDYTIAGQPPQDLYNAYGDNQDYQTEAQPTGWDDYAIGSTASANRGSSEPAGIGAAEPRKEESVNV
jgi:TatA/E family protein of Tat protein translocase